MNNYILDLIKETVYGDQDSNVNKLYRMFWINILEQFKKNPINYDLFLWIKEKGNDYHKIIYYDDGKMMEVLFKMNSTEKEELKNMLLNDGFTISDNIIKISREKIMAFAKSELDETKKVNHSAVPETGFNMIDKIKKH